MRDHHPGLAAEFAGDDEFLGVAAGQQRGLLADAAHALHIVVLYRGRGLLAHRGAIDQGAAAIAAGPDMGDGKIVCDRQASSQRIGVTIGRDRGDGCLATRRVADVADTVEPDLAGGRLGGADQRLGKFGLAVAADACDAVA